MDDIQHIGRNLWLRNGQPEAIPGGHIDGFCADLVEHAKRVRGRFTVDFNGIGITAGPNDNAADLALKWRVESDRRAEAYRNSDEYKEMLAEMEREDREQLDAAQAALSSAPDAPTWSDAAAWRKWVDANPDGYGGACVAYAHRWARLMEAAMASGETLAECATRTSHLADTEGITGAMYGAAVSMLSQCWIHGEDLRRWHNKDIAPGEAGDKANESGGVINPAIITIG